MTIEEIQQWDEIKRCWRGFDSRQNKINRSYMFASGVYVIMSGDRILYIGESKHLQLRLSGHSKKLFAQKSGLKDVRIFVKKVENRKQVEADMIYHLQPEFNVNYKKSKLSIAII